ncbi:hypothetical protein KEM48_005942 [Puccinia striiformis f. sp. tritici PST-130]|nr:hypothetical protein KEM48_005942 [Puccinia striiformis f. sp. tritici PST-130]
MLAISNLTKLTGYNDDELKKHLENNLFNKYNQECKLLQIDPGSNLTCGLDAREGIVIPRQNWTLSDAHY